MEIDLLGLSAVEFSADGRRVAEALQLARPWIAVRDVPSGRVLRSWPVKGEIKDLLISPDGNWLLWRPKQESGDKEKPVWTTAAVKGPPPVVPDLQKSITSYFSPDGRYLVTITAHDSNGCTLQVHDCNRKFTVIASRTDPRFGSTLAISRDSKRLVTEFSGDHPQSKLLNQLRFKVVSLPDLKDVSSCELYTPESITLAT